ncbi:MAG: hypothetical protein IJN67_03530 [Oscillospiraceae bacterium]|nr:hypothetical protein [Oscillospiraceae bacterium]
MNRKLVSKAISNIQDKYIMEAMAPPAARSDHAPERTSNMGKYENKRKGVNTRRLIGLASAACLVFSLAITAYALNLFGIREMFRTANRELPESAEPYIQQHTEAAAAADWSARITESLCDTGKILTTVTVSGGDRYIVVPTDAMPEDSVGIIGIRAEQTLREYAAAQGKELLFVGATLRHSEHLGVFEEAQRFVNGSAAEMNILLESSRSGETGGEAICKIYARDIEGNRLDLELPFTLEQVPAENERVYVPVDPDAIPGMTVGEATVKETPLGLSVRWMETVTDQEVWYNIMKVEVEGVTYREGGAVLEDDGNWYFQFSMGEGSIGDTMTVHFYDWDKVWIGDITFERK